MPQNDFVFDVGLHLGEDTDFYLQKGYRVVAVDAHPHLVSHCRQRFADAIAAGQLIIIEGAIAPATCGETVQFYANEKSVWGTINNSWAERNRKLGSSSTLISAPRLDPHSFLKKWGVPHYLKLDIEGAEMLILEALAELKMTPRYISIEAEKVSYKTLLKEFDMLERLGYKRFKVVQQQCIPGSTIRTDRRDGTSFSYKFQDHSTGPFGDEAAGDWLSATRAKLKYLRIFSEYRMFGDAGWFTNSGLHYKCNRLLGRWTPGWHDTHATI